MRITIVQGAFFPVPAIRGGAIEKIWWALGKEFAAQGHDVVHLSRLCDDLAPEEVIDGVQHIRLPSFDPPASGLHLKWRDLRYTKRVLAKLKTLPRADIVVTNTFWLPLLAPRDACGKLYVHVARFPKGQMRFYGKAVRLQGVSSAVGRAIRDEIGGNKERVAVIQNPVETYALNRGDTAKAAPSNAQLRLLYVGRVHPEKGLELLLDAYEQACHSFLLESAVLDIVGPYETAHGGGGEVYLKTLQDKPAVRADRARILGPEYDVEKLHQHYQTADLFLYPSLAEKGESFGIAPLEAMARGCPALVSDLEVFRDFIQPDARAPHHNGYVFDHRASDPATQLAEAIKKALADPAQLQQTGQTAWETSLRFSYKRIAQRYLEDFEQVLAGMPPNGENGP